MTTLALIYLIWCAALFLLQGRMMFPRGFAGAPSEGPWDIDAVVLRHEFDPGRGVVAWLLLVPGASAESPRPLVVFFHGNAELIDHQAAIVALYRRLGASVLMVEYRGYGHSDGTPAQKPLVDDAVSVIEQVIEDKTIDAGRLVLHGRSIGGGIATQVALEIRPVALVVESTTTSVAGMAWRYGVPPFLVKSPLNNRAAFERLDLPILILHGRDDEIFPLAQAEALQRAGRDATLVTFNASHNTLPSGAEIERYERAIREHLIDAGAIADDAPPSND